MIEALLSLALLAMSGLFLFAVWDARLTRREKVLLQTQASDLAAENFMLRDYALGDEEKIQDLTNERDALRVRLEHYAEHLDQGRAENFMLRADLLVEQGRVEARTEERNELQARLDHVTGLKPVSFDEALGLIFQEDEQLLRNLAEFELLFEANEPFERFVACCGPIPAPGRCLSFEEAMNYTFQKFDGALRRLAEGGPDGVPSGDAPDEV